MRRALLSSCALLSACIFVLGCGSSSSTPSNINNAKLNGTYVFMQQVYTYYNGFGSTLSRSHGMAPFVSRNSPLHGLSPIQNLNRPQRKSGIAASQSSSVSQGSDPNSTGVVWGAMVGSLTFDGNGHITGGEIDYNEPQAGYFQDTVTGAYTVNQDNSGSIRFVSTNQGAVFFMDIALQGSGSTASGAQLIESYYDLAGNMEIGTGVMLQQTGGFTASSLNGNYVFGMQGETCSGCSGQTTTGDLYAAGMLAANGSGAFGTASEADVSSVFSTTNQVPLTGSYGQFDTLGRSVVTLNSGGVLPQSYALYIANPSTVFLLAIDNSSTTAPAYLFGQAGLQTGTFSNATLSGNYVVAENTEDLQNANYPDSYSDATLAVVSSNGGVFTGTGDTNQAGKVSSNVPFAYGTYSVDSNGRVTFNGKTPSGAPAPVFWLQNASFGFGIDQLYGSMAQQPGLLWLYGQSSGNFSAATLKGYYAMGTLPASTSNSVLLTGVVTSDGSANLTGSGAGAFFSNNGVAGGTGTTNGTYTVGANGRGTITGTSTSVFGNGILYLASGTQGLTIDVTSGDVAPSIQTLQP